MTVPNPVSVGVGDDPTSPVTVVVPVLEIPEPPRTAKISAVPKFTVDTALTGLARPNVKATTNTTTKTLLNNFISRNQSLLKSAKMTRRLL